MDFNTANMFCPACDEKQAWFYAELVSDSVLQSVQRTWCLKNGALIHVRSERLAAFIRDGLFSAMDVSAAIKLFQYEIVLDSDEQLYDSLRSLLVLQGARSMPSGFVDLDRGHIEFVDAAIKRALGVQP